MLVSANNTETGILPSFISTFSSLNEKIILKKWYIHKSSSVPVAKAEAPTVHLQHV